MIGSIGIIIIIFVIAVLAMYLDMMVQITNPLLWIALGATLGIVLAVGIAMIVEGYRNDNK